MQSSRGIRLGFGVACLFRIGPAAAQSVIKGSIRIDSTSRPVVGAQVSVEGRTTRSVTTNSAGDFQVDGLDSGQVLLQFRAIGFRPFRAAAALSGQDTLELDVQLVPLVQQLAALEIVATRPRSVSGKMEDFERRRKAGFGRFFTRAELSTMETGPMSNALRHAAGVQLIVLPNWCGNGMALASGRRPSVPMTPSMSCGDTPPTQACYVDIFIDGAQFWRWGDGPPIDIEQFAVRDYQAIEVYRGRSELPIEMSRAEPACGAIAFWTRTGEP